MATLIRSVVTIPAVVDEIITVQINDAALMDTDFDYQIIDEKSQVCRKGHFKGRWVQMRVSNLKDGIYSIKLCSCAEDVCAFGFEKISLLQQKVGLHFV